MSQNSKQIKCPNCDTLIDVETLLSKQIEADLRGEMEGHYKQKMQELLQKEKNVEKAEKEYHERLAQDLVKQEKALKEKLDMEFQADYDLKLKTFQEEIQKQTKKIREMELKDLEYQKMKMRLENQEEDFALKLEKTKLTTQQEAKKELEEKMAIQQRERDEQAKLSLMEKEKTIDAMKKQIDELKQKAEQGSMQLQGEVQEMAIEEELRALFPDDLVIEVPKGRSGADSILQVRDARGLEAGKIIYESKRTKNFSPAWLSKLKNDQRQENADIAVLVSQTLPQEVQNLALIDGVWVCSFSFLKPLSLLLRDGLLKVHQTRDVQKNSHDKMQLLYDFLTSNEFKMQIEAILEGFDSMRQSLSKERLAMEKIWKEREKQLDKVLINTTQFYASVKGIAGAGVPEIKMLEFD
ncbi:MAG: DUF2130 domain-containing protein [Spirochaetales bacterium]|nr:DUF2130 domain-containing protein [Spirochaetales bacterium]